MNQVRRLATLFALGCVSTFPAIAGDLSFRCQGVTAYVLSDDGTLVAADEAGDSGNWARMMQESEFDVSRETGQINSGPFITSENSKQEILHRGNSENAFRLVQYHGGLFQRAELFQVITYAESDAKPFIGVDPFGQVFTGTCN